MSEKNFNKEGICVIDKSTCIPSRCNVFACATLQPRPEENIINVKELVLECPWQEGPRCKTGGFCTTSGCAVQFWVRKMLKAAIQF